jgi:putative FmdB family regulatory protein
MPLYEYICEEDGTVVEVLRPAADADKPLADPEGRGRTFRRRFSTFATGTSGREVPVGGFCPCGKPGGGCGRMEG